LAAGQLEPSRISLGDQDQTLTGGLDRIFLSNGCGE
jgi:hypothetical protein